MIDDYPVVAGLKKKKKMKQSVLYRSYILQRINFQLTYETGTRINSHVIQYFQ